MKGLPGVKTVGDPTNGASTPGLTQATNPLTGKGAHTAAPNKLPGALGSKGKANRVGGAVSEQPGHRKV